MVHNMSTFPVCMIMLTNRGRRWRWKTKLWIGKNRRLATNSQSVKFVTIPKSVNQVSPTHRQSVPVFTYSIGNSWYISRTINRRIWIRPIFLLTRSRPTLARKFCSKDPPVSLAKPFSHSPPPLLNFPISCARSPPPKSHPARPFALHSPRPPAIHPHRHAIQPHPESFA